MDPALDLVSELGGPRAWLDAVGIVPAAFTVAKLRWMADHEPELADRVTRVMLPHDYLTPACAICDGSVFDMRGLSVQLATQVCAVCGSGRGCASRLIFAPNPGAESEIGQVALPVLTSGDPAQRARTAPRSRHLALCPLLRFGVGHQPTGDSGATPFRRSVTGYDLRCDCDRKAVRGRFSRRVRGRAHGRSWR
ncbi:hypothetical protein HGA07_16815 [Nocardia veterana]|uniref:Carbohydrate kinase FGGY N-terminal domain-containing protein n=1 Tax=Nocardia veterana TaxID=132249 RepID=A0A7X6LZZ9_9NOCA|nr:hypothetical protein [Nocardia veterana]